MPEPSAMPFSIWISKPWSSSSAAIIACNARAAVLRSGSSGSSVTQPVIARTRTPGVPTRCTLTRSPAPLMA